MAFSTDVINTALDEFYRGDDEMLIFTTGDRAWDKLQEMPLKVIAGTGATFRFNVVKGAKGVSTPGGLGAPINFGTGQVYERGTDYKNMMHWGWREPEQDLRAINHPEQLANFLAMGMKREGAQCSDLMGQQVITGSAPTDVGGAFGGIFTLHGGTIASPVSYTPQPAGVAQRGLIVYATPAIQRSTPITRHGISAGTVSAWVNQYKNSTGGWAAGATYEDAIELLQDCTTGAMTAMAQGVVPAAYPDLGICSGTGYRKYLTYLRDGVRYVKGGDDGKDTGQNSMGGVYLGENTRLFWSKFINDALTTQFSGYNGVLKLINTRLLRHRTTKSYAGSSHQSDYRPRRWSFKSFPALAHEDQRHFRADAEMQITCLHLPAFGGMDGWDRA